MESFVAGEVITTFSSQSLSTNFPTLRCVVICSKGTRYNGLQSSLVKSFPAPLLNNSLTKPISQLKYQRYQRVPYSNRVNSFNLLVAFYIINVTADDDPFTTRNNMIFNVGLSYQRSIILCGNRFL